MIPAATVQIPAAGVRSTRIDPDRHARADCGAAPGRQWALDPDADPPSAVDLPIGEGAALRYRLIVHPRTLLPARDHQGRYLYLPVRFQPTPLPADARQRRARPDT